MILPSTLSPPMVSAGVPGTGGRIKVELADFEVEEVPAYEPSGSGEHLYLWVEKRGVGPEHLTRLLAERLGARAADMGTAGLKDRHAVTRQWISVPATCEANLARADGGGLTLLKVTRHANKLKPGHLRGNRFRVLIRGADPEHAADAARTVALLESQGLPNSYGPQRFGRGGETANLGFACLAGTQPKRLRPFVYKFALSAAQSVVFNEYLARRFADGLYRTVITGDVLMKHPAGGLFVSTDAAIDQSRLESREVVIGGPMVGSRLYAAAGVALERETELQRDLGITPATFERFTKLMGGTRRHLQVYPEDLTAEWEPAGLRLTFTLPSGSYATSLLREVIKPDGPLDGGPSEED